MIQNIANILFQGKPLVMYGGLFTFIFLLFTATVGVLNTKGFHIIPYKWYPRLAIVTIGIATIHAIFGL